MTKKRNTKLVYSTNPSYKPEGETQSEGHTLPPGQQQLGIRLDNKKRKGKVVTLITGFVGRSSDLKTLGKELRSRFGVGGSVKDSLILLQGDLREEAANFLRKNGYEVRVY